MYIRWLKYSFIAFIIPLLVIACTFIILYYQHNKITILKKIEDGNSTIWVYQRNNNRCLSFDEPAISTHFQTCIKLNKPLVTVFKYYKMLLAALYFNPTPKRALMIGLGGGVMIDKLLYLVPNVHIDVVEINSTMVNIAKEFFDLKNYENVSLYIQDGVKYIANYPIKSVKYDLIILDASDGKINPPIAFLTQTSISKLKQMLTSNGIFAMNGFANSTNKELEDQLFKDNFGNYYQLSQANLVRIAAKSKLPNIEEIIPVTEHFKQQFQQLDIDTNWLLNLIKPLS